MDVWMFEGDKKKMSKILAEGTKVRYVGEDLVTYVKNKVYTIEGYDEDLEAYGVMSELGEIYCVDPDDLEEVKD